MGLDSLDLLEFIKPKLQRLADEGVTNVDDQDQQEMVKLIARKYLEALENPLPRQVPVAAAPAPTGQPQADPNQDLCAPPGWKDPTKATTPAAKRGAKVMSREERILRAKQAAREASEESHSFDGEFADEAIGSPMGSPPPPSAEQIQYDPHTGQPLIQARPLQLPQE